MRLSSLSTPYLCLCVCVCVGGWVGVGVGVCVWVCVWVWVCMHVLLHRCLNRMPSCGPTPYGSEERHAPSRKADHGASLVAAVVNATSVCVRMCVCVCVCVLGCACLHFHCKPIHVRRETHSQRHKARYTLADHVRVDATCLFAKFEPHVQIYARALLLLSKHQMHLPTGT